MNAPSIFQKRHYLYLARRIGQIEDPDAQKVLQQYIGQFLEEDSSSFLWEVWGRAIEKEDAQ